MPENIRDILEALPLGDKGRFGSLRHIAFVAGTKEYEDSKSAVKETVLDILCDYYNTPGRFEELWERLSDAEKEIVSFHAWGKGLEPFNLADEIAEKYGVEQNTKSHYLYYYYSSNALIRFKETYAKNNSALWLLFLGHITQQTAVFNEEIKLKAGEMKREYSPVSPDLEFVSREERTSDFANIVRFCNSNTVSATEKSEMITKSSAVKLHKFCGYDEFVPDMDSGPLSVKKAYNLFVTFPLTVFGLTGGLLTVSDSKCTAGVKALSLLDLTYKNLIKILFDAYLKDKKFDEILMINGIKAKRGHSPARSRQNIVKELMYCKPNQPIPLNEFERYLRISSPDFARKDSRHVTETGKNSDYDDYVSWEQYERPLIDIIIKFFFALGIVDAAWNVIKGYDGKRWRELSAFRINDLGAYVLGMTDSYISKAPSKASSKGGFVVLPDYTVIVPEGSERLRHEINLDKLLTKVSQTDEAAIYKIDFKAIAKLLEGFKTVAYLREYLERSDKPLPENIIQALSDWERQSKRIKIKHAVILECDDEALLEEVIHYRGMDKYVKEKVSYAAVVQGDAANDIKKLIEKNKRFCIDDF